jgi:8-oxo-dGTP pyrophosphatase MutT (NUDIX family)
MIPHLAAHLARHPAALLPSSRRASVAIVLRIAGAAAGDAAAAPDFLRSALAAASCPATTEVLFIKRAARDGDPWSGHVAFPGGKNEGESDMACAARETLEEVGLDLLGSGGGGGYLFLGRLDDRPVYTGGKRLADSAFCAGVWVQTRAATPPLVLQRSEVAEVRWVRVSALLPERVDARGVRRPAARYLPPWLCALLRVQDVHLPAIELPVPPGGGDCGSSSSSSSGAHAQFLLWGMSLQATSDLVMAAGAAARPLNWPPALADNAVVDFGVRAWCGAREVAGVVGGTASLSSVRPLHLGALGVLVGGLLLAARQVAL